MVLGETSVFDPKDMVGKGVSVNLMVLTNNSRNQNVKVNFKISKVTDNKGMADLIGYELVTSSIKRMVRRNVERIDDSFVAMTLDGIGLRIKPIMIARQITAASLTTSLRKASQQAVLEQARSMKYEMFMGDVIYHKLQETLKKQLSKIYPVKIYEIKAIEITQDIPQSVKDMKPIEQKPEEGQQAPAEEEAPVEEAPQEE